MIPGYPGYMATDDGRIYSIKTKRFLKPSVGNHGYESVSLRTGGKTRTELVHRLVALAFVPNDENLPFVNHKDETRKNNAASNLEWVDCAGNANYGTAIDRRKKTMGLRKMQELAANARKHGPQKKLTVNLDTGDVYESALAASKATGIHQGNISACCNGKNKTAGGYRWAYQSS